MKKFIRNCIYVLAIIILLSFILPSFIAKADNNIVVKGTVKDKNGNLVEEGIKVTLCDNNGNPIKTTTSDKGEYSLPIPDNMDYYKLKFEYSGYELAKAEQIGVKDYIHTSQECKKLETRYVVPKEEKDTLEKRGIIKKELDKCGDKLKEENGYSVEEYWITYDNNKKYDENGNASDYSLTDIVKNIETPTLLNPKIANIAIIIKATNNMPGIKDIKDELRSADSVPGKYKYFVLDSNNIFNDVNGEKTIICKTEDELIEKVCNYIGFVIDRHNIEIGNSNEDNLTTDVISSGENATINLSLGDKKEENPTPENPNPPTPTPNPTPSSDPDAPTQPQTDPTTTASGSNIKGIIKIKSDSGSYTGLNGNDYPVTMKLTSASSTDKHENKNQDNKGEFGFNYLYYGDPKDNYGGTYTLEVIVGNQQKTTNGDYNGQNYDILYDETKVKAKFDGDSSFNDIGVIVNKNNANRDDIDNYYNTNGISKEKATSINIANKTTGSGLKLAIPFTVTQAGEDEADPQYEIEIVLQERPKFELEVTQEISAAQMILSNGQILKSYKAGDGTSSGMIGDKLVWDVDDELKHGATVQIEYEITVTNKSNIDCNEFKLIDYLDYNNASLQYRSDANLITENKKNSEYGWTTVDINTFVDDTNTLKLQDATEKHLDEGKTYLQLKDSIGKRDNANNKDTTKTYKLVASMVITSELAIDNYQNAVEIISYKNEIGRVDRSSTPGTYDPSIDATYQTNDTDQADSAKAEEVSIIPPTGTKQKWYTQILETILNMFI